ncbi:STAS domain-containing protein [Metabacillus iocasae]|uniref:Anti-anti-sigma regulatory factor n=1 Tax=Priestia iocasae TaxID=2291674 RepID=A0ABS2QWE8_9BACI|nr:STAS domain-containing protein [Metabacillus iocasae]MBM7703799.1 anti-anti-sigma regulatory factor [Metabacillus iocasae]
MHAIGQLPSKLNGHSILENIQETIIVADLHYQIQWLNSTAVETLSPLFHLYGVKHIDDVIGLHMDMFHSSPAHQQQIMKGLESTHRARITIKNLYVAETVIHPIYNEEGEKKAYLLMLLDVTKQAKREQENEQMIEDLSSPLLKIWDEVLALPIVGKLDHSRSTKLAEKVLQECVKERARYFLIDLSSLKTMDDDSGHHINIIHEALRLIGTTCLIVGISAQMAQSIVSLDYHWKTFGNVRQGIAYILKQEGKRITSIDN